MNKGDLHSIGVATSDLAELSSLRSWLHLVPGLTVTRNSAHPDPGELGARDTLTVVGSNRSIRSALRAIPDFVRSRKSDVRVTVTIKDAKYILDVTNVDSVIPTIEHILDELD